MSQRGRIIEFSGTAVIANSSSASAPVNPYANGVVRGIYINAPALTSADTYTFAITGANTGQVLFSKASLVANSVTNIMTDASSNALQVPIDENCMVQITSSGTEGAQRTFSFVLIVDRGNLT